LASNLLETLSIIFWWICSKSFSSKVFSRDWIVTLKAILFLSEPISLDKYSSKNSNFWINFLSIPSTNNKIKYYRNELNASLEVDETSLPFNDLEFDKVFVSHWLEVSDRLDLVFSELWRVLKGQGKIIFILPNSFSLWSNVENNPFGKCRPFSKSQIKKLLNLHGFEEIKVEFCLYFPPYNYKLLVKNHKLIENIGRALFRNMGGVMVIEATKFNYAIPKKQLKAYRYIFPKVSLQQ